jgi:hypothetical protein
MAAVEMVRSGERAAAAEALAAALRLELGKHHHDNADDEDRRRRRNTRFKKKKGLWSLKRD